MDKAGCPALSFGRNSPLSMYNQSFPMPNSLRSIPHRHLGLRQITIFMVSLLTTG